MGVYTKSHPLAAPMVAPTKWGLVEMTQVPYSVGRVGLRSRATKNDMRIYDSSKGGSTSRVCRDSSAGRLG